MDELPTRQDNTLAISGDTAELIKADASKGIAKSFGVA